MSEPMTGHTRCRRFVEVQPLRSSLLCPRPARSRVSRARNHSNRCRLQKPITSLQREDPKTPRSRCLACPRPSFARNARPEIGEKVTSGDHAPNNNTGGYPRAYIRMDHQPVMLTYHLDHLSLGFGITSSCYLISGYCIRHMVGAFI